MRIETTSTGGKATYSYDDFTSGLIPQGTIASTIQPYISHGYNGLASTSNVDPNITNGILQAGYNPSANATNNGGLAGLLVAISATDNSTAYAVDAGGKIQKITTSTNPVTLATGGTYPATITGTSPVGQDGILYTHFSSSTLVTSYFYSYYNNANWDVGALLSSFAAPDDNFMSTVPTNFGLMATESTDSDQKTKPHPMEIGADGILYIGSGRYLHAYDGTTGTNGTFSSKVLTLPLGTEIIAMRNFNDKLLIATNYSPTNNYGIGNAELYIWNYLDLDISTVISLEDISVSALFLWDGTPMVITEGAEDRNGSRNLKAISGNTVKSIASWNAALPTNRGVLATGDILYMNCDGKIVTVGSNYKSGYMVNQIASLSGTYDGGALQYITLGTPTPKLLGSSYTIGTPNVYYLQNITDTNRTRGAGFCSFPMCMPSFPAGKRGRIKSVDIRYFEPITGAGGTFTLSVKVDNTTTHVITSTAEVVAPLSKRYTRNTSDATLPLFSTFQVTCEWASSSGRSPSIADITVEWELVEIKN